MVAENLLEEAAAVSAEKLSMVKRRLKHALHAMEPAGSIPAIHKADRVNTHSVIWKKSRNLEATAIFEKELC